MGAIATKPKSVIFKDWQIEAALAGRLSLLVVPVKPQPTGDYGIQPFFKNRDGHVESWKCGPITFPDGEGGPIIRCPFGPVGRELIGKSKGDMIRVSFTVAALAVKRVHRITDAEVIASGIDPIHVEKNRPFFHRRDIHALAFGEFFEGGKPGVWRSNPWAWFISLDRRSP